MPDHFPHTRKRIHLTNFDYTLPDDYFVTVCAYQKRHIFGQVVNAEMVFSDLGAIVYKTWQEIPNHFPDILLGAFVVMPNHMHGILHIHEATGSGTIYRATTEDEHTNYEAFQKPVKGSVSTIIRTFKAAVTRAAGRQHIGLPIWQRNYYEHIIRTDKEFIEIEAYILNNPLNWFSDEEYT